MEKIKNAFRQVSTEIIAGLVATAMTTGGLSIWALLRHIDGFYIALIAIGVLAVSMVFVNQLDAFFQRRKKPLHQQSDRYIDTTLHEWLYRRGFSIRNMVNEKYEFLFLTKDIQERPILVGKPKGTDELILQLSLVLKPEETAKLDRLDVDSQRKLLTELRVSLARHMVGYVGIELPLKTIVVTNTLLIDDSFTRDMVLERIDRIRYALVLILELLNPILERQREVEPQPEIRTE